MQYREKVIECLQKAKMVIETWVPMFEQYNTPAGIDAAIVLLKEQQEIVRCKDCIYRGEINCPQYYRRDELSDDYFCADGERKEGQW